MEEISMEAAVHLGVGLIFCSFLEYERSLSSLIRSQQLALSSGDECREDLADRSLFEALEELLTSREQNLEAGKAWSIMVPLFEKFSESLEVARCWSAYFVGTALSRSSPNSARFWLDLALESASGDESLHVKYRAAGLLGRIHESIQSRARYFQIQTEAARCLGSVNYLVYALENYAKDCIETGDYSQAFKLRQQLIDTAASSGDELLQAIADKFCGTVAFKLGQYRECITLNTRVVDSLKPLPSSWLTYYGYSSACGISAASPSRAQGTSRCIVEALHELVHSHSRLKETGHALARAKMYEDHLEKLFNTDTRRSRLSYLNSLCALNHSTIWETISPGERDVYYKQAEAVLVETLELSEELGDTSIHIGALVKMTDLAVLFKRGPDGELRFYLNEEDGAYFEMLDSLFAEAERLAEELRPGRLLQVLSGRSLLNFQMNRLETVTEKLEKFARLFFESYYKFGSFSRGRILFNEDWKIAFQILQAALIQSTTRPHHALIWAERERARDLIYNTSEAAFSRELMEFDLDDAKALQEIFSIPKHQGDEETVFLMYTSLFGSRGICGFLMHATRTSGWFMRIEEPWKISKLVQATVAKFRRDCNDVRLLQWWYQYLIQPFDEKLEMIKPKKLVIIPGEDFSSLPFAALFKEGGEPFLIQRYAISYIPSLRMYKHCKARGEALMRNSKRMSALVIGNPATSLADDLPYAEEEASSVKESLTKAGFRDVKLLEKHEATKEAVLSKVTTADWIHFSCHATVDKEFPNGALLLASESFSTHDAKVQVKGEARKQRLFSYLHELPPSDVLTGAEIEGCETKLQALVTVLSACESGLGEVFSEGVLGIYRSLHVAGAPSVVCSLWSVDDESTKFLMEQLYEKMLDGTELAIAMQKVMMEMIDDEFSENSMIRNWATFIISGNPNMKLVP